MEDATNVSLKETLLPALLQCFGIILIGYILGRTKVFGQTEARGLSIFVRYLSLPALIFTTVSTIPFSEVKWEFIASVFVAKASIFMCVSLITMLLTHPINLGKSALFGITATQSNDFALGYPLLVALYHNTHPEYPSYLYIIAPIQLLILNTVGFFMLEIEKDNENPAQRRNCQFLFVLKGTLQNPVVIMTIIGLIWNVSYGQKVLPIFESILEAFSSAFPATALLLVGYTMSVRSDNQSSQISISVLLLILTKNIILPLILQKFSAFMLQNSTEKEIQNLSSMAFLYGTIPTAPSVYVFAVQYNTCIDAVTKSVIGSTLFAAPIMFATASVISLAQIGIENVSLYLSLTISYISIFNIVCCVWLIIIFWVGKRWRSLSFGIIFYLILAQFLMALGGIMLFLTPKDFTALFYIQYILTNGSTYATRTCIFLLAILLLTIRIRSLCFILKYKKQINIISVVICVVLPYAVATSLLLCEKKEIYGPNFQLGFVQIVTTFIITLICSAGTIVCLILHQIYLKRNSKKKNEDPSTIYYQNPDSGSLSGKSDDCIFPKSTEAICSDIEDLGRNIESENCHDDSLSVPEQISCMSQQICDSHYQCSAAHRIECSLQIARYMDENNEIGTGLIDDECFFKHIVLLILFCLAMIVSLFVCFWKLLMEEVNGIFIEIEFLDVILNFSLGIVCFGMFGLNSNLLVQICAKLKINTNCRDIETTESKRICELFLSNYYQRCKKDIGQIKLIDDGYRCTFNISDFTKWLIDAEVIQTNQEVEFFIDCLLKGHIVEKQCNQNNSLNDTDLYIFPNDNLPISL